VDFTEDLDKALFNLKMNLQSAVKNLSGSIVRALKTTGSTTTAKNKQILDVPNYNT
jgi:hypothetical protein